jgi:long-chain acyl-CoA synthetase
MPFEGEQASAEASVPHLWLKSYPANVNWNTRFTPRPLFALLDDAAAQNGSRPCTTFLERTLTYSEIAALVNEAAAGLQRLGVAKGTKVGLFLPNCPTFIVYYYAVLKAGGTVVNYNPLYTVDELAFQIKDSDTSVMVTLDLKVLFDKVDALLDSGVLAKAIVGSFPALLPKSKSLLFKLFKAKELSRPAASKNRPKIVLERELLAGHPTFRPANIDPLNDLAVLQYTGGTTGTPKGAMLTHANVYINTLQVTAWAPDLVQGQERVLGVLPFFHVFAMTVVMNFGIAKAAEIIIMPRFQLDGAMKLIHARKPTIMPGVPTLFNAIANHPKVKDYNLRSLNFCLSGGAPLMLDIKQNFERATGCTLIEGYGLSEASPVVTCNPLGQKLKPGSIGLPLPATVITLRDTSDPMREVPQGERGEVCVQGPQVMAGYWNKPVETAQQFAGPHLRTGDVGIMDEDGFFFIVDRIKDLIICSGYNVYPRRIEEAISEHPAVEEVCVIGIPDQYRGEAPKAFIKLKGGMDVPASDIQRHLEPKLSKIEMPAAIEFRDSLPKTMIGKLSKKELKEEEARKRAGA